MTSRDSRTYFARAESRAGADLSDAQQRELFTRIHEGFYIAEVVRGVDGVIVDFVFLEVNDAFTRQTDIAPDSALGRRVSEVIPGFPISVIRRLGTVVATGSPTAFEVEIPALGHRAYEARAHPVGKERFAVLFLEITDRKRIERELTESRASLSAIVDSVDQLIWSARPDGYHDFFNRRWYEYSGTTPGTSDGDAWALLFHPDDRERTFARWRHSLATGEPYEIEYRMRDRSGEYRWMLGRAHPVRNESGEIIRWMGTCTDIDDTRRIADALRASEERFRTLYEAQHTAHLVLSPDLVIESASFAYLQATMTRAEDLVGRHMFEAFPDNPDDPAATGVRNLRASLERVLENHAADRMPVQKYDIRRPSGQFEVRWWAPLNLPVFGDDGSVRHIIHQVEDVTAEMLERQKAAEAQADEARLRQLADAIAGLVFESDAEGRNTYVNEQYCAYTGIARADLLGQGWHAAIHPDDLVATGNASREAALSAKLYQMELRIRRADGAWRWFMLRVRPILGAEGQVTKCIGVCTDIDDGKRAQDALRESERQFRELAETLPQLAWMADEAGSIYWYNRRWYEYTGASLDEMRGWGWRRAHHPEHVDLVAERIRHAFETGEPWEDIFPLRSVEGTYRWFLSRALPMRNSEGGVIRWFGTNTDITEKQKLEDLQKMLIQEISHRVKNSLALVSSLLTLQARTLDGMPRRALEDASSRVQAVATVHDQLWRQADAREIDLAPFVRNLAKTIARTAPQYPTLVKMEPAVVPADRAIPIGLWINEVLTNAYKYAYPEDAEGEVLLQGARTQDGQYHLQVTDFGRGLPPDFDFDKPGNSLGTRVIKSLATQLDGQVSAGSATPGTRFTLTFPLSPRPR